MASARATATRERDEETARLREQREAALTAREAEKRRFEAERDEEKRAALLERDLERARLREAQAEETARLMDEHGGSLPCWAPGGFDDGSLQQML